jgi:cytochrome b pre-mRNA-processing protein 3
LRTLLSFLSRGQERSRRGAFIYSAIVEQARRPQFYESLDVPDTIDGRFDLIVLHAGLYLPRLKAVRTEGKALAQSAFDQMFVNFEHNLRELGVGDMGVPRRVKGMVSAFYGRVTAYEAAIQDGDVEALRAALQRNVYRGAEVAPPNVHALANYVRAAHEALKAAADADIAAGTFAWPAP